MRSKISKCARCGTPFTKYKPDHVFCGLVCWNKNRQEVAKDTKRKTVGRLRCVQCGAAFISTRDWQKFCGFDCQTRFNEQKRSSLRKTARILGPDATTISKARYSFLRNVTKTGDCWMWTRAVDKDGYGLINTFDLLAIGELRAHRASWVIAHGLIPKGLWVLHHCDTPGCVNPDHLYLGTAKDNSGDREDRGRGAHPTGENNPLSKLTESSVKEIRESYAKGGVFYKTLASKYNVSKSTVHLIVQRRIWKEV